MTVSVAEVAAAFGLRPTIVLKPRPDSERPVWHRQAVVVVLAVADDTVVVLAAAAVDMRVAGRSAAGMQAGIGHVAAGQVGEPQAERRNRMVGFEQAADG